MNLHPFERFLGVAQDADAYTLLGLTPERCDVLAIDEALRRRVAEVFRHPDGRSEDAEMVRVALREAADALRKPVRQGGAGTSAVGEGSMPAWMQQAVRSRNRPRAPAPTPLNLTAFDRLVLATLVACGGWNARSRAQLVALAQQYDVSVQGLLRVMQGLSAYARSGGPRIGVTDIASRQAAMPLPPVEAAAPPPIGIALLDRLADNLGHELKRGGAWPTIKLAIIFGIATVILGVIALKMIVGRGGEVEETPVAAASAGDASAGRAATSPGSPSRAAGGGVLLARYPRPPTFLGNGLPGEAVNAVDRLRLLPARLDELSRRISVAHGEPSEAVYRQWESDVDTMALSWTLADGSTRATVERAMMETLRTAGDTPAVSDRLLRSLVPPTTLLSPLDIVRGTWMAGTLARIASTPPSIVQPVVADRARSLLEVTLSQTVRGSMSFEHAGDAWLGQRMGQMVQMLPFDEKAYDTWELWLSAHRGLGEGERQMGALAGGLQAIMETDYDLAVPAPPVNVAARLLKMIVESNSALARQRVLDLFENPQVTSRDMWVLTSLLRGLDAASWFPERLVIADDADMAHRWRVRDDLSKLWPMPVIDAQATVDQDRPPAIDPLEGANWADAVSALLSEPLGRDQTMLMQQLVDASRLIEAAGALVAESPGEARRLMRLVANGWSGAPTPRPATQRPGLGSGAQPRSGQSIGPDGTWAARYGQLGRNTEARTEAIRALRTSAGTDLGPIDAALLVREAYRGSPQEVRTVAQLVLAQQFSTGPTIAIQLLDQFPDAPINEQTSEMIQQVTGRMLPGVRTSSWQPEARLALVQHALNVGDRAGGGHSIDTMLEPLVESYMNRLSLVKDDMSVSSTATSPQDAAGLLLRALMGRAEFAAPLQPVPGDLPNLTRRHLTRLSLAEGPIQSFVAHQLGILDVTAYQVVAEQPRTRERVLEAMRGRAMARMGAAGVLEQAVHVERAILELWRIRLGLDPTQMQEEEP